MEIIEAILFVLYPFAALFMGIILIYITVNCVRDIIGYIKNPNQPL